ncbi:MAG: 23S rRNA (pseudouridine(1915)-N(3))-methyltransferase RlmH [Myxococcota bacterium]|nr:23S rRNA (pseudouridine(1915)-N(3))-methyltransferase RlmH [Myxococcota bacterium]MEC8381208.1 23S rRNA (pseudouridine(1915)-N(3))-methyltransferase RlmH [Myxococcota bacterium]
MNVLILRVAKAKCKWADAATTDYLKRMGRHLPVKEHLIRPAKAHLSVSERRAFETDALLACLKSGDRLVVMDERGDTPTTEELQKWVESSINEGCKRLVFAIGGPFGHAQHLHSHAWKSLALSKMVLNHELARVVLSEQLYRVYTLMFGGDYHH